VCYGWVLVANKGNKMNLQQHLDNALAGEIDACVITEVSSYSIKHFIQVDTELYKYSVYGAHQHKLKPVGEREFVVNRLIIKNKASGKAIECGSYIGGAFFESLLDKFSEEIKAAGIARGEWLSGEIESL
jgi:hypothetical protein